LGSFSVNDFELSIADLYQQLGIHKSTLVRLLQCMMDEGFIDQNPKTGEYRLGIKTFEIGSMYHRTRMMNMGVLARPIMERLATKYRVSANLAILDGKEIVYVETVEPAGLPLRLSYATGDRFGIHHTALGKAMIAFLPPEELQEILRNTKFAALTPRTLTNPQDLAEALCQVKEQGWAVDDEESLPGLRCVGAPIWDNEKVIAGLSASGSTLSVTKDRVQEIAEAVTAAAAEISEQLGWRQRQSHGN